MNYNLKIVLEAGDTQNYGGFADIKEISVSHYLQKGWNLINLAAVPDEDDYYASDLLDDINNQGGFVTRVMRFRNGRWDIYRMEGSVMDDFRLKLGEGYVVKADRKSTYVVKGKGFKESVPMRLGFGWNLIAIPYSEVQYTAVDVIDVANDNGAELDALSRWDGRWVSIIKEGGLVYGNDFDIENNRSYFVRNYKAAYWTP